MMKLSVLSLVIFLAIFLGAPTAEGDVSFHLSGATRKSFGDFMSNLRRALPSDGMLYNIPLLLSYRPGPQRYTLVHLTNYAGQTISAAMDVTNVNVMGYSAGDTAYFFDEPSAAEAAKFVFKDANRKVTLPYSGNYERLEIAAGKTRENIYLGLPALDSAITNLFDYNPESAPSALIQLMQCVSETARFKYIEQQVGKHVEKTFLPNPAILSLENSWPALSKQIQLAQSNNGEFVSPVVITNPQGQKVEITNVNSLVVTSNIALLLNRNNIAAIDHEMPVSIDDNGLRSYVSF